MSKQVNTDYLIKLLTEKSYAISRVDNGSSELGMTLSDMIHASKRNVETRMYVFGQNANRELYEQA